MSHELIAEADSVSGLESVPTGYAVLVVRRGPTAGSRFLLGRTVTSAGRHPDSDICLDHVTVSRRHAEFRLQRGAFHLVDVGSLNGTYVNREPIDSIVLANGDEIQMGKFRLVFFTGPAPS
jgi:pSer/pThr/pTyr-binding forkhead associated (FHA) protein